MACMLCEGSQFVPKLEKDGHYVQTCTACGLTQLNPLPSEEALAALYDAQYYEPEEGSPGYGDYFAQRDEYLNTFREDLKRISNFVDMTSDTRILDLGCGPGYFMQVARDAGLDAYGVDVIEPVVKQAQQAFPDKVFLGPLEQVEELKQLRFDAIFSSHVIEHIANPGPFVETLGRYLKPGGILVLVTPNVGSWLSRVSGPRWVSYKIPEHVAYYNPATITTLLEKHGFDTEAIDPAYQYYRVPFVAQKLRALVAPIDRIVPRIENAGLLRERIIRITSGSLRAIARR